MKILLSIILLGITLHAGVWNLIKNSGLPTVQSQAFQIEVEGENIRGYTFKPEGVDMVCVSVFAGEGASHQMECKTFKELGLEPSKK